VHASSFDEHRAAGARLRDARPPGRLASWRPAAKRKPLVVLKRAAEGRDPKLVRERNTDMAKDDPTFFRGAAGVMADDLAATRSTVTGLWVDVCGDAHLGNFGTYGSPERHRLFDLNDFDEARAAPWEWDVCRLAASAAVTARHLKLGDRAQADAAGAAATAYAETLATLATGPLIDRWYVMARCELLGHADIAMREEDAAGREDVLAHAADLLQADDRRTQAATVEKLTEGSGTFHDDEGKQEPIDGRRAADVRRAYSNYRDTLPRGLRRLLSGYRATSVAKRPVGEGSLGLRNYLVLLEGHDARDALILQVKEATPSQLDFALEPIPVGHEGKRVARMQRTLQGASDPLLGWTSIGDQAYYVRQFRDMKSAPDLEKLDDAHLRVFARLCGTVLARAHARSADSARGTLGKISGYVGSSADEYADFCHAIVSFAQAYAEVTAQDRELLASAIREEKHRVDR
jgi:uncharacterized protein (DUF2252 family)